MAVESAWGFSSVATKPPTLLQRRLAYAIVAVIAIAFAVTIPLARVQLAQIDIFAPTVNGITFVTDLLTAICCSVSSRPRNLARPRACERLSVLCVGRRSARAELSERIRADGHVRRAAGVAMAL
jgi:hypothetical protein